MPKNLVIVESPAKAKTIEKFLGADFQVMSSFGHIRDLPKKGMGINIENNFAPTYEITPDKVDVVAQLKKTASKADKVWLASDEDREGEAISWHLYEALELKEKNTERIVFHEITKNAILKAIQNPRKINVKLVDAQQARRVLDRIVGFEVSPVLWKKVKAGLSAGRVQSVAVRIIVEREKEIINFIPQKFYRTVGLFQSQTSNPFKANLTVDFSTQEEVLDYFKKIQSANFSVSSVEKKPGKRSSSAPFTTSSLQQAASSRLGLSVSRTMRLAQQLYEAGHITYMRTDSVNLSEEAILSAQQNIEKKYGKEYASPTRYKTKNQSAQEAHEAIRPTNFAIESLDIEPSQAKLYKLIWQKAIASQMSDAKIEKTIISIANNKDKNSFEATGEVILFDGFLKVYPEDNTENNILPKVKEGESLNNISTEATEKFTKHPARYSEAALVKKMEELGIGRPSTYAPTISTIQARQYVEIGDSEGIERKCQIITLEKEEIKTKTITEKYNSTKKKLLPTDVGIMVTEFLVNHFEKILDYNFTAQVESSFDEIANGSINWNSMIGDFYKDFHPKVTQVLENSDRVSSERVLGNDPVSGKKVIARMGKFGPMIQIGETNDEVEKPKFASIPKNIFINNISLEEALKLFQLPKLLGTLDGNDIEVNTGRYGPYIKFKDKFISIPKSEDPYTISMERTIELIREKEKIDAPISTYNGLEVTKGKGRFGPFIKWNNLFINVNKKYDFDNLSQADIKELIEDKLQKESQKTIHHWEDQGISVEKARWGRFTLIQGKTKIELPKETDVEKMKLEDFIAILEKNKPKKATTSKKTTTTKKSKK